MEMNEIYMMCKEEYGDTVYLAESEIAAEAAELWQIWQLGASCPWTGDPGETKEEFQKRFCHDLERIDLGERGEGWDYICDAYVFHREGISPEAKKLFEQARMLELMTPQEVAEAKECDVNTIYRILRDSERCKVAFPGALHIPPTWRIPVEDVLKWKPGQQTRQTSWYVVGKSLHQGDNWKIVGGPYHTRQEANAVAENSRDDGIRERRQNLAFVELAEVWSRTKTVQHFGSGEDGFERALADYYNREAEREYYASRDA
jgi:hypothetical protein